MQLLSRWYGFSFTYPNCEIYLEQMLPILIQSLVLASAGLLSVGSITIIILLLISDHGLRNGLAYMLSYLSGCTLIGAVVVFVGCAGAENSSGEKGKFLPLLFIICRPISHLDQANHRNS